MLNTGASHAGVRERIIAREVGPVADDLRLLDVAELIALIKFEQFANVASLVTSSIELSFAPETLGFGHGGSVAVEWGKAPTLIFDMEFHHQAVHAYFRLFIEHASAGVELDFVRFERPSAIASENTSRLAAALKSARSKPAR
jgi:hypothetical protein